MPPKLTAKEAARIAARPFRSQWDGDEPMTLAEALAIGQPHGPMTVRGLRTARNDGQLATAKVANKVFTTLNALAAITAPVVLDPNEAPAPRRRKGGVAAKPRPAGASRARMTPSQAALAEALAAKPPGRPRA